MDEGPCQTEKQFQKIGLFILLAGAVYGVYMGWLIIFPKDAHYEFSVGVLIALVSIIDLGVAIRALVKKELQKERPLLALGKKLIGPCGALPPMVMIQIALTSIASQENMSFENGLLDGFVGLLIFSIGLWMVLYAKRLQSATTDGQPKGEDMLKATILEYHTKFEKGKRTMNEQEKWTTPEAEEIVEKAKELVKKGNISKIFVKRNGETIVSLPLNVGIIGGLVGAAAAPWALITAAIATVGFDCVVELQKDDGTIVDLSGKTIGKKAADIGAVIVDDIQDALNKGDNNT